MIGRPSGRCAATEALKEALPTCGDCGGSGWMSTCTYPESRGSGEGGPCCGICEPEECAYCTPLLAALASPCCVSAPDVQDWRCECGDLNRWHESSCYRCGAGRPSDESPSVSAADQEQVKETLLAWYRRDAVGAARYCDEVADPSGALLGEIRARSLALSAGEETQETKREAPEEAPQPTEEER